VGSSQNVHVLVEVVNPTTSKFTGELRARGGDGILAGVVLEPGELKQYAGTAFWHRISEEIENSAQGTWQADIVLREGSLLSGYEVVDERSVELEVVPDSEPTATGPGITNIMGAIPVNPGEVSLFVWLFETGSLVAKAMSGLRREGPGTPYMTYQSDLADLEGGVRDTAWITIDDDGVLGGQRRLTVKWQNRTRMFDVYVNMAYDAADILVRFSPGTQVIEADGGTVISTEDGYTTIEWEVVKPDKLIRRADGLLGEDYSGTFSVVIEEPDEPIEVDAELLLLLGPFQRLLGSPPDSSSLDHYSLMDSYRGPPGLSVALSDFSIIYNYDIWAAGGGYWYPVSRATTSKRISP